MTILLGVDGTGAIADGEYRRDMRNSFVSYILRESPVPRSRKHYRRGPGFDGLDMAWIVNATYQFVHLNLAARPRSPVLLTGYSRGGAAVIGVAQRLQRDRVNVAGMILFDAVDRAVGVDTAEIPNNVQTVFHVRRSWGSFSRHSFGNCGTRHRRPTVYTEHEFNGTHGAMGGVHWRGGRPNEYVNEGFPEATPTLITYAQDLQAARSVWRWVEPHLNALGFL